MMKEIITTNFYYAQIDDQDYEWLNQYNWHYNIKGYISRTVNKRSTFLHKLILIRMGHDMLKFEGDHIDRNRLNNQRSNLRPATHQQNMGNQGLRSNNTSGYKGVFRQRNKWAAYIKYKYTKINLGVYVDIKDAARAYNSAAKRLFGEYADFNIID